MPDPTSDTMRTLAHRSAQRHGISRDVTEVYADGWYAGFDDGVDDGANTERRRIILAAVSLMEAYRAAAATVLTGREREIADNVTGHAIEQLRALGCICPDHDVTGFGEIPGSRTIKGRDHRCGMHEEES